MTINPSRRAVLSLIAVALIVTLALPAQSLLTPSPAAQAQEGYQNETLALIQDTVVPKRDRLDLARRLLGVTDIPDPPTEAPPEYNLGDTLVFFADNLDEDYAFEVSAELVYKTDHVYMFVETGYVVDSVAIARSAEEFETVILPEVRAVFGQEWSPGIDGDPHLYILHATNLGDWVAAYYGSNSEYPVEAVENSNEHEMFFVNLDTMQNTIGTDYYEGVLSHEFQHMVHWYVDQNEDTWLNEGLSELATMLTGYGVSGFAPRFLDMPSIQLNTWPEDGNRGLHYGAAFLFAAYFYDRYGREATTALVQNENNGLESLVETLETIGATDPTTGLPVTLVDLFADWVATLALFDPTVGDGRYAYHHSDLRMWTRPAATVAELDVTVGGVRELYAPQWGPVYIQLRGGDTPQQVRVGFEGSSTVSIVPAAAHSGRYAWWANRGDDSNPRLTQHFDLTGVDRATLDFWAWYYIESLWDYAYITVSTDGGATWTALETAHTTADDPHHNAYGPGYTGSSGDWIHEQVDLTAYAGQQIQIRFEYITDDAVTQPGLLIDDVSLPEIGYFDDFENGDGGWLSEGWLRMDNELAQHFLVQAIQPGNMAAPVTRWLDDGQAPVGQWELTVGGEYGDAVLAVSGLALVTTETADFKLVVTPLP